MATYKPIRKTSGGVEEVQFPISAIEGLEEALIQGGSSSGVSQVGTWFIIDEPEIPQKDFPLEFTSNGGTYVAIGATSMGSSSWGINALSYQRNYGAYDAAYTNNPSGKYGITHGWANDDYRYITVSKEPTDLGAIAWLNNNTNAPKVVGKEIAMGKVISFANQKGGVGKTTSAVNVAASLGLLGSRVLLIDLDPQGNATSGVGIMKRDLKGTTREFLAGDGDPKSVIHETEYTNLWVIPANTSLAGAEFDLFDFEESEYRLKNLLAPLKEEYDYIIIDCPPSLGMLTVNSLSASDGIVVPMQCEFYSLEGLSQLMMTIKRIKRLYNPDLSVTGILVTMYNGRLLLSMQVLSELKKHYGDKLFSTEISRNVKLSEAPGFGKPVYYHDRKSKGSVEYMEIAKELRTRI